MNHGISFEFASFSYYTTQQFVSICAMGDTFPLHFVTICLFTSHTLIVIASRSPFLDHECVQYADYSESVESFADIVSIGPLGILWFWYSSSLLTIPLWLVQADFSVAFLAVNALFTSFIVSFNSVPVSVDKSKKAIAWSTFLKWNFTLSTLSFSSLAKIFSVSESIAHSSQSESELFSYSLSQSTESHQRNFNSFSFS